MNDPLEIVFGLIANTQGALALIQANEKIDPDSSGNLGAAERLMYSVLRDAHRLRDTLDSVQPAAPIGDPSQLKSIT